MAAAASAAAPEPELAAGELADTAALLVDGARVFHPDAGVFVAATAAALALGPCFGYSLALWARKLKRGDREALCSLVGAWACATLVPLALGYGSTLFAYLATFAACAARRTPRRLAPS